MEEFLRSYGVWIVIAAFIGLHWFGGMRCGRGHRHDGRREDEPGDSDTKREVDSAPRRGCH